MQLSQDSLQHVARQCVAVNRTSGRLAAYILILEAHNVSWEIDGMARLYARDVVMDRQGRDVSTWQDVTDWTKGEVYRWLGY